MLIGDKRRFAVQHEVAVDVSALGFRTDPLIPGHCCFWAGGVRLGNFETLQLTRTLLVACEAILERKGDRAHSELAGLSAAEIVSVLDEILYGTAHDTTDELHVRTQKYWGHNLLPQGVESFDGGWRVYIVEDGSHARLIHRHTTGEIGEVLLLAGEADDVFQEFVNCFTRMYPLTT